MRGKGAEGRKKKTQKKRSMSRKECQTGNGRRERKGDRDEAQRKLAGWV